MPTNFTEMKIPVPYGYIAAKVWGSLGQDSIKVIAMHGYVVNRLANRSAKSSVCRTRKWILSHGHV